MDRKKVVQTIDSQDNFILPKSSGNLAKTSNFVIPAKAGIQSIKELDSASSAE
jgi:hypothetical protein